jgi:hypothetical protein
MVRKEYAARLEYDDDTEATITD